jgi:cytochrome c oxidase cbb3-type subunit 4
MNPIWGPIAGVSIIVLMLTFVGIWIWAWLPHHKPGFDELAHLPLEDDDGAGTAAGDRR